MSTMTGPRMLPGVHAACHFSRCRQLTRYDEAEGAVAQPCLDPLDEVGVRADALEVVCDRGVAEPGEGVRRVVHSDDDRFVGDGGGLPVPSSAAKSSFCRPLGAGDDRAEGGMGALASAEAVLPFVEAVDEAAEACQDDVFE
jgi:hypothetical protein